MKSFRLSLVSIILILNSSILCAQTSNTSITGELYQNGRPNTKELGEIREITGWKNFLYVSWMDLDGDFWLDAWNIRNPKKPLFVSEYSFGNIFDDASANLPVAHLKLPRDLKIINGRLIYWSLFNINVHPINTNGSLEEANIFGFDDSLNVDLSRPNWGQSYASINRKLLTDQEFLDLLANNIPINDATKLLQSNVFANFENPISPFLVGKGAAYGKPYMNFENPINGAISGYPAIIDTLDNKLQINISTFHHTKASFLGTFWEPKVSSIFVAANLNKSLNQLINTVLSKINSRSLQTKLLSKVKVYFKKTLNFTFPRLINKNFRASTSLKDVLNTIGIKEDDTVELALEKIIEWKLDERIIKIAASDIFSKVLPEWRKTFFAFSNKKVAEIISDLKETFDKEYTTSTLVNYFINKILAPLVDNPPYMTATLESFEDSIDNSPVGTTINSSLELFHTLFPIDAVKTIVPFDWPDCADIPNSSTELFDMAFVNSGPRLDINGNAFFEILKAIRFYTGHTDLATFTNSVDEKLKELHETLSQDVLRVLTGSINFMASTQEKVDKIITAYGNALNGTKLISKPLALSLKTILRKAGVKTNLTVKEALLNKRLYIEIQVSARSSKSQRLSTVRDLNKTLKRLKLNTTKFNKVFKNADKISLDPFKAQIRKPLENLIQEMFGSLPLDSTLRNAVDHYLATRIDPNILGNFTSTFFNDTLDDMAQSTPLPGLIGSFQLAAQGDCISKWRLAIQTAAQAAALLQQGQISLDLEASDVALGQAYNAITDYLTNALLHEFVERVVHQAGTSFPSFISNLDHSTAGLDLTPFISEAMELIDVYAWENIIAVVPRNVNWAGVLPGKNRNIEVLLFDKTNLATLKGKISLGEYTYVDKVTHSHGVILIEGTKSFGAANKKIFTFVEFKDGNPAVRTISGDSALSLSGVQQIVPINGGNIIAARTAGNRIMFVNSN